MLQSAYYLQWGNFRVGIDKKMNVVFVRFNGFDPEVRFVGYVNQDIFDARSNVSNEDFSTIFTDENDVVFQ